MKEIILFFSVLLLFINTIAQDAHWPLDIYTDDMVGDNDGVPVGGVNFIEDAVRGQVMLLDGLDDYVQLPYGLLENVTDITITCWFNWAGGANWQRVYSFGYSNTVGSTAPSVVSTLYLCPKDDWQGNNNLHLTLGGPFAMWRDYSPQPIDSNKWYFSAFIKKADSLIFYLDDQIIVADTFFMTPADLSPDSMNWIGKSHWPDPTFNGMIDEMRLYKSALTHSEVLELYTPVTGINEISNYTEPLIYTINGKIFIEIDQTVSTQNSVEVLNILGKMIYSTNKLNELSDMEFQNGIYLVKLAYNNKVYVKKILVKN